MTLNLALALAFVLSLLYAAILAKYNHEGVPFYLVYGRKPHAAPQILPEVLTPGLFLEALNKL
jgi:thiol:disulfide interchange protein